MPRTKNFDQAEVLKKITDLFWEKGYHDTSMDDVVSSSGVSRSGIYSTFGDKKSLFIQCIDHYKEFVSDPVLAVLNKNDSDVDSIFEYFDIVHDLVIDGDVKFGCFFHNSSVELGPHDDDVENKIASCIDYHRESFKNSLTNAKENGQIEKNIDIEEMSDYLLVNFVGILVLAKSSLASAIVDNAINFTLAPLRKQ